MDQLKDSQIVGHVNHIGESYHPIDHQTMTNRACGIRGFASSGDIAPRVGQLGPLLHDQWYSTLISIFLEIWLKTAAPFPIFTDMEISQHAARLEALGNETRLSIFRILVRAGGHGLAVGAVQQHTGLARSTLSHHLHKLISVGLASQRREGTTLYCCAEYPAMNETLEFLRAECCVDVCGNGDGAGEGNPHTSRRHPCTP